MLNKYNHIYNYEESIIHYMNTIIKIVSFGVYILIMLFKFNNVLFILNISLILFYILFSNIKITKYLNVIWNIKHLIIFMYIFMYYRSISFMRINYIVLYLVFSILFIYVIIFTSTKEDLSNGLGSIFNIGIYKEKIKLFFYKFICFKEIFINNLNKRVDNLEISGFDVRYRSFIVRWGIVLSDIKIIYEDSKKDLNKRVKNIKLRGYNVNNKRNHYMKKIHLIDVLVIGYDMFMIIYYILVVR